MTPRAAEQDIRQPHRVQYGLKMSARPKKPAECLMMSFAEHGVQRDVNRCCLLGVFRQIYAEVAKLVDARVLNTLGANRAGSNPAFGIFQI